MQRYTGKGLREPIKEKVAEVVVVIKKKTDMAYPTINRWFFISIICWFTICGNLSCILYAQETSEVAQEKKPASSFQKKELEETEVNFLFNYYNQDGKHSAVTGGEGTEKLEDYASVIIVHVPLDSVSKLSVNTGVNYYTSASTDRIDFRLSSASREDVHIDLYTTYTQEKPDKGVSYSLTGGVASESDYLSTSLAVGWNKEFPKKNTAIDFSLQAFFDKWALIFPDELRGKYELTQVPTNSRTSYNFSGTYTQVLHPRWQASISGDVVYQRGLLSTPFHRVYFRDTNLVKIEKLPETRLKLPIGLRLHYFLDHFLIVRFYYRYYWDSFGVQANTLNLETPVKLGNYWTVSPFYRFHTQTQADYFQPYQAHALDAAYYTSDFDLSRLQSHKWGMGVRYKPLYGIGRFKFPSGRNLTMLKNLELRYARYYRSDGLTAFLWSLGLALGIR